MGYIYFFPLNRERLRGETRARDRGIGVVVLAGKWEEVRQVCIGQRINARGRGGKCT